METTDWRGFESEAKKREVLQQNWGDTVNTYLWYEIDDIHRLTKEEKSKIIKDFFPGRESISFGDLELHESRGLSGSPTLLRLRGRLILRPSLTLRGRYCPLYQVGHYGGFPGSESSDLVNFQSLWKPQEGWFHRIFNKLFHSSSFN